MASASVVVYSFADMKKEGSRMIISVTKQIIEIVSAEIMQEVATHPEVKDAEEALGALLETILSCNPELFDKVENAIYEYTDKITKHTCPVAFIYGMRAMSEINQITNQPNIPV